MATSMMSASIFVQPDTEIAATGESISIGGLFVLTPDLTAEQRLAFADQLHDAAEKVAKWSTDQIKSRLDSDCKVTVTEETDRHAILRMLNDDAPQETLTSISPCAGSELPMPSGFTADLAASSHECENPVGLPSRECEKP